MGSSSSRLAKKLSSTFRSSTCDDLKENNPGKALGTTGHYLVFSRRGSMYKDEEGDLAHEFYIEVPATRHGCKATMQRIYDNLTPQGEVYYEIARLHYDFPYIIANL